MEESTLKEHEQLKVRRDGEGLEDVKLKCLRMKGNDDSKRFGLTVENQVSITNC